MKASKRILRANYINNLLTDLKKFERKVNQLANLSKFIHKYYFIRLKKEILNYGLNRSAPPYFETKTSYLYLLYRGYKQILSRIENCLILLKSYIKNDSQKNEFKQIGRSLISPNLSNFRSHLFELFVLGRFIEIEILVEPYYQKGKKIYDALVKMDKCKRLIEITSLQESKHDLSKRDTIGVADIALAMQQVIRKIMNKTIKRGQKPDIFILALGDFASDMEAGWGIDKLMAEDKIESHIFVTLDYLGLEGKLYISPNGSSLSEKEIKFFEILR